MGSAERKERDKQEMKEMILSAAKKLFLKDGFEHVTIRRIADEIEYSPATVYLYFKDKDSILYALQGKGFQELFGRMKVLNAIQNPAEKLRAAGKIYIDFAMENPELYDLMFIMMAPMNATECKDEWDIGKPSYEALQNIIKENIDQGYIKSDNPQIACFSLWALMHGVVSLFIRNRAPMIPKDQRNNVVNGILDFTMQEILDK